MRKGVSPIIATVILITITVSLAFIIFTSGKKFITQLSPPPDCSDVFFEAGIYQTKNTYSLEVNNKGNKEIVGFTLIITDESKGKTDLQSIDLNVEAGKSASKEFSFEESISGKKIQIVPIVKNLKDQLVPCDSNTAKHIQIN